MISKIDGMEHNENFAERASALKLLMALHIAEFPSSPGRSEYLREWDASKVDKLRNQNNFIELLEHYTNYNVTQKEGNAIIQEVINKSCFDSEGKVSRESLIRRDQIEKMMFKSLHDPLKDVLRTQVAKPLYEGEMLTARDSRHATFSDFRSLAMHGSLAARKAFADKRE